MFGFLKRQSHLIGVDLGNDCVKLAQLANGAGNAPDGRPVRQSSRGHRRGNGPLAAVGHRGHARGDGQRPVQGQGRRRRSAARQCDHRSHAMAQEVRRQDRRRHLRQDQAEAPLRAYPAEYDDQVRSDRAGHHHGPGDGTDGHRPPPGHLRAPRACPSTRSASGRWPWHIATPSSSDGARPIWRRSCSFWMSIRIARTW